MRILLTTDTIGGVWTFTRELTQQLLKAGHSVALVGFGRAPNAAQSNWCEHLGGEHGVNFLFRYSATPLEWMQDNATAFSGGIDLLLQTAKEFRADLLHANQFCWGALPGDLPRIITAHSDVLSWGLCCRPEGLQESPWLERYRTLVQCGLNRAEIVVAPTDWMGGALRASFHVPCEYTVIYNGRTVPRTTTKPERRLQAVSVGRLWDEAKGIETLFDVDSPIPIYVAGEDSFDQASVTTDHIGLLGQLEESAVFDLFRSSSIYIASSFYEPFGLAPLEAALCGCAVVARDIPSLREVWSDAALFYDTPEKLAALLHELANHPEVLRIAQRKAQARAERFTAARMAGRYLALYRSLVTPNRVPSSSSQELATHAA